MTRIMKDPEERRIELIDMAEKLFIEKGFEQTLISDIVKSLGVAQGTFYYYFKSKDDILNSILERKWEQFASRLIEEIEVANINPLQKLQIVFSKLFMPNINDKSETKNFKAVLGPAILSRFHQQFDEARIKILKPLIAKIIKQGIEERVFREINYPDEVIDITFYGINLFMHIHSPSFRDKKVFKGKMSGLEEMLEIMLGVEKGSFKFIKS
jgi:AcrR family transcriptional regulator